MLRFPRFTGAYRVGRCLLGAAAVAIAMAPGCRVFTSLEDCSTDAQCRLDQRCHPEGHFCELDTTPIEVGVVLPLTGSFAKRSEDMLLGIELATREVNAAGGILGRPVTLVVEDDEASAERGERLVRGLVARGVAGIVGGMPSATTLRLGNASRDGKVVFVTPVSGSSALAQSQPARDRYLFQTVTSIARGSALTMSVFARRWPEGTAGCRKMVIVHNAGQPAPGYREAIEDYFPRAGGCVVDAIVLDAADKEEAAYAPDAQKLLDAGADCAALITSPVSGARFVRAVARSNASQKKLASTFFFVGQTTVHADEFLQEARVDPERASPTYAAGVVGADIDTNPDTQAAKAFRVLFNDFTGAAELTAPPQWSGNAFDALALVALAVERAGAVRDRERVRDAIFEVSNDGPGKASFGPGEIDLALKALRRGEPVNYTGASGPIEMDDFGVVANRTLIWRVASNGAFEILTRYSEEEPEQLLEAASGSAAACR